MASIAKQPGSGHRISLEDVRPRPAKTDLNSVEVAKDLRFPRELGRAVQVAISLAGLANKEAAGAMGIDPAQLSRWIAGTERPQFDRLFAVEALRQPLCVALAQMAGADVHTHIQFRKVGA